MDEAHFVTALRYIALNPVRANSVRARLVSRTEDWCWSSNRALRAGEDDHVVTVAPALERAGDFATFLSEPFDEALGHVTLRKAENVGRPIGSPGWLSDMETRLSRAPAPQKPGPRPKLETERPDSR